MGLLGRLGDRDAARGPAGMLAAVGAHELRRRVGRWRGGSGPADLPSPSEIRSARGSALVDPARHADFVRAVSGEPTPHAHGGYLHALTFPVSMRLMTSGRFPLSVLGLVHLRNRVEHLRAVEIGTTVHIHSHVLEFGEHRRGTTVTIVAEVWDATGRLAFRDESLYLALGPAPGEGRGAGHGEDREGGRGGSASGGDGGPAPQGRHRAREQRPDARDGARRIARWRLPASTGRRYAAVSGDVNPIHLSTPSARALGMKGMIAHGMYAASRTLSAIAADASAPCSWTVEFGAPIVLPAEVSIWRVLDAEAAMSVRGVGRSGRLHFAVEHSPRP